MTVTYCDCCGKEMTTKIIIGVERDYRGIFRKEVCKSCANKFSDALKNFEKSFYGENNG